MVESEASLVVLRESSVVVVRPPICVEVRLLTSVVVRALSSKSKIGLVPYARAYAPGFDDMRRRKPLVKKLERFVKFHPRTPLREIIRLTAG